MFIVSNTSIDCSLGRFHATGLIKSYNNLEHNLVISINVKMELFNVSLLLDKHGHPLFLFYNQSSMINIQWTMFEQKSMDSFISGNYIKGALSLGFLLLFQFCQNYCLLPV